MLETGRPPTNLAREGLIQSLAKDLYFTMERYDPVDFNWDLGVDENWAALSDRDRDIYVHAVGALLSRKKEILLALGGDSLSQ